MRQHSSRVHSAEKLNSTTTTSPQTKMTTRQATKRLLLVELEQMAGLAYGAVQPPVQEWLTEYFLIPSKAANCTAA
jgi:hypothetical protein